MEDKLIIVRAERIKAILDKYPNRRVHVAIEELFGEEVYKAIKEGI